MAGSRARAGQLIGQAAPAAKSARARAPASWIDPSAVAFQIMLCGPRKEKCMAARARAPASWPIRVSRAASTCTCIILYTTLSTPAPVCKVKCTSADKLRVKPPSMIADSFPQTNSSLYYSQNFTTCYSCRSTCSHTRTPNPPVRRSYLRPPCLGFKFFARSFPGAEEGQETHDGRTTEDGWDKRGRHEVSWQEIHTCIA
jgi:hypothetical protein